MSKLHKLSSGHGKKAGAIVFVHGIQGDHRETWESKKTANSFWPLWIVEDFPAVDVYALEYSAKIFSFSGANLSNEDQACNVLAALIAEGLDKNALLFICHSLGGILAQEILRTSMDFFNNKEGEVIKNTAGVVFIGTPNFGSSLAKWLCFLLPKFILSEAVYQLKAGSSYLRRLNVWYRQWAPREGIATLAFSETLLTKGFRVVNSVSSDPAVYGVLPIPLKANHFTICKPVDRTSLLFARIHKFINEELISKYSDASKDYFVPVQTVRLFGRSSESDALTALVTDGQSEPILVFGAPGIGKTALTLALFQEVKVVDKFSSNMYFAELEIAKSGEAIFDAIGKAIGLPKGFNKEEDVINKLGSEHSLLVLDNLETPWEADSLLTSKVLMRLAAVPKLQLVASIRGTERPRGMSWRTIPELEPLNKENARSLFLSVAGTRWQSDPQLEALLDAMGGLPLAIELMAYRIEELGNAKRLLREWERYGTQVPQVGSGSNRQDSLSISIELSLASSRMSHAGLRLFHILGQLPDGLSEEAAERVLGRAAPEAVARLLRVGLVRRDQGRLRMLPPVREHARTRVSMTNKQDQLRLLAYFHTLCGTLSDPHGRGRNPITVREARLELVNIDYLLSVEDRTLAKIASFRNNQVIKCNVRLAVCCRTIAEEHRRLGSISHARRLYDLGIKILSRGGTLSVAEAFPLSANLISMSEILLEQGEIEKALRELLVAWRIAAKLSSDYPNGKDFQRQPSLVLYRFGQVWAHKLPWIAVRAFRENYRLSLRIVRKYPDDMNVWRDLSASLQGMAHARSECGLPYRNYLRVGMKILVSLVKRFPEHDQLQRDLTTYNLFFAREHSSYDDRVSLLKRSLNTSQRLAAGDTADLRKRLDVIADHETLAITHLTRGKTLRARRELDAARTLLNSFPETSRHDPSWLLQDARLDFFLGIAHGRADPATSLNFFDSFIHKCEENKAKWHLDKDMQEMFSEARQRSDVLRASRRREQLIPR